MRHDISGVAARDSANVAATHFRSARASPFRVVTHQASGGTLRGEVGALNLI